uniref:Uncharacterized protein n=1 Tax=Magnetospirillum gryphiswaldense TaxID=55518 RepID=A4TVP4_9PROT|nr:hypothetical protein MGR_0053 [Magnetospirillum gryphiswaldense MSR-1]
MRSLKVRACSREAWICDEPGIVDVCPPDTSHSHV